MKPDLRVAVVEECWPSQRPSLRPIDHKEIRGQDKEAKLESNVTKIFVLLSSLTAQTPVK